MFNLFKITPKKRTVKIGKKYGILYSNPPTKKKIIFYVGNLIILFGLIYLGYLYTPLIKSLVVYKFFNKSIVKIDEIEKKPINNTFSVSIPKIGAESKIIANVSPYNEKEYLSVLSKDEVAQSSTSSFPGMGKNNTTYLFAHSTQQGLSMVRKNSVFYLLGELTNGNSIYLRHNGNLYQYKVYDKKIISYKEAEYLNYKDETREVLILQTCWPIGTNWKRLLIFAERI
ncbi:hypothetical protein SDC9_95501 [bioreactor metagenome]|uniref:Sortase family protein n=1 Tax=bioreactor metagenome TaxID=1076179 RepID=A0A645AGK8_9ZZZZ